MEITDKIFSPRSILFSTSISPISPILTIFTPMKIENGMYLGEMLLSVISLYHDHERKRYGKKNALEIKERQLIFVFCEISYT